MKILFDVENTKIFFLVSKHLQVKDGKPIGNARKILKQSLSKIFLKKKKKKMFCNVILATQ